MVTQVKIGRPSSPWVGSKGLFHHLAFVPGADRHRGTGWCCWVLAWLLAHLSRLPSQLRNSSKLPRLLAAVQSQHPNWAPPHDLGAIAFCTSFLSVLGLLCVFWNVVRPSGNLHVQTRLEPILHNHLLCHRGHAGKVISSMARVPTFFLLPGPNNPVCIFSPAVNSCWCISM